MMTYDEALKLWESHMLTFGRQHADVQAAQAAAMDAGEPSDFGNCYYDGARVFQNIRDYTGDPSWDAAAHTSARLYRDLYVFPNDGTASGHWLFPHGLAADFRRTGDVRSKDAVLLLNERSAWCGDMAAQGKGDWLDGASGSRECAYALMCHLITESLTGVHQQKTDDKANQCLGYSDQWFVARTLLPQPFMVALACEALILLHDRTADPRVLAAVKAAGEGLWATEWIPQQGCFYYNADGVRGDGSGTHDLNLLILPLYGWLYTQTKDARYLEWGDQIFVAGVQNSYLAGNKQFNQSYRWSFDYVRARAAMLTVPPPVPPPVPTRKFHVKLDGAVAAEVTVKYLIPVNVQVDLPATGLPSVRRI